MPRIDRVLESVLYVADLDGAERFYADVLGLALHSRKPGLFAFFRCGPGMVLLFDPHAAAKGRDVPAHGARGPGHLCFAVAAAGLPAWRGRLRACGVAIEAEVSWPGGGESVYFRDPAGNSLELATPALWDLPEPATGAAGRNGRAGAPAPFLPSGGRAAPRPRAAPPLRLHRAPPRVRVHHRYRAPATVARGPSPLPSSRFVHSPRRLSTPAAAAVGHVLIRTQPSQSPLNDAPRHIRCVAGPEAEG